MEERSRVAVIGGGAFGTAVANLLAENFEEVLLWCYEKEVASEINELLENRTFLRGIKLNGKIRATHDLRKVVSFSPLIFEAIPVKHLRITLTPIKNMFSRDQIWVVLSKGVEGESFMFPSQILEDLAGKSLNVAALSGPTFAIELVQKFFSAADLAVKDLETGKYLQSVLECNYFRVFVQTDLMGVQFGGAIKNVIALAIGMASGWNAGKNMEAFLLSSIFTESLKLLDFLGGKRETLFGLSGIGDLFLTVGSKLSKNRRAGEFLGRGGSLSDLSNQYVALPEGINTIEAIHNYVTKNGIKVPLLEKIYRIVFEGESFADFFK